MSLCVLIDDNALHCFDYTEIFKELNTPFIRDITKNTCSTLNLVTITMWGEEDVKWRFIKVK